MPVVLIAIAAYLVVMALALVLFCRVGRAMRRLDAEADRFVRARARHHHPTPLRHRRAS